MHFSFVLLLLPSVLSFSTVHPKLLRIDRCFRITALRAPSSTQDIFSRNNVINRFTLEKPIYKPSVQSRIAWDRLPVAAASAVALTGIAVGSIRGARLAVHILFSRGTSVTSVDVDKKAVPYIQYSLWSAGAKLQHAISSAVESGYTAIKGKGNPVDLSIWSKATLLRATDLPGGYTRYRFNLESPDSYLPLDLGQEVLICTCIAYLTNHFIIIGHRLYYL